MSRIFLYVVYYMMAMAILCYVLFTETVLFIHIYFAATVLLFTYILPLQAFLRTLKKAQGRTKISFTRKNVFVNFGKNSGKKTPRFSGSHY